MAHLNPCLDLLFNIKRALERGENVKTSTQRWAQSHAGEFQRQVHKWILLSENGGDAERVFTEIKSSHRRALLRLVQRSMEGLSILEALRELEKEVIASCREEMDTHMATLPYKLMLPLLLLVFPTLLMLLFAPLLSELSRSFTP